MEYLFGNSFTDVDMFHEAREIDSILPRYMTITGVKKGIA